MSTEIVPGAQILALAAGWIIVVFIGILGVLVLWNIYTNRIDLKFLLCEDTGKASLSRFQFLVFTFVIAMSFVLITLRTGTIPDVPQGVWALLGISGGSYVIAKGIQKSAGATARGTPAQDPQP
jgi:hypothetical protein